MMRHIGAGRIYHVLNRGVDKRVIFLDDRDYLRFIHDLFEFNDTEPANNTRYLHNRQYNDNNDIASRYIGKRRVRKLVVEIMAFCLMPNHYHLLVRPVTDDALSFFMKKLNIGYAKYFNEKYERTGTLFQGRFKAVEIKRDAHFTHIPYYIHFNPLDLVSPEWRDRELRDYTKAVRFLASYRWSSHLDYLGKKNFPSVTQREFLLDYFGGTAGYEKNVKSWLKDINLEAMRSGIFE